MEDVRKLEPNGQRDSKMLNYFRAALANMNGQDACVLWPFGKEWSGYGHFSFTIRGKAHCFRVHRLAWQYTFGPIPKGLYVCHRCDTPACFNPKHLFLGTLLDNQADKWAKGRSDKKLTKEQVLEIRSKHSYRSRTHNSRHLAEQYGVTPSAILMIWQRKTWRWLK